jgi:hypothetical protein
MDTRRTTVVDADLFLSYANRHATDFNFRERRTDQEVRSSTRPFYNVMFVRYNVCSVGTPYFLLRLLRSQFASGGFCHCSITPSVNRHRRLRMGRIGNPDKPLPGFEVTFGLGIRKI